MTSSLTSTVLGIVSLFALGACVQPQQSAGETLTGSSGPTPDDSSGGSTAGGMTSVAPPDEGDTTTGSEADDGSTTEIGGWESTHGLSAEGSTTGSVSMTLSASMGDSSSGAVSGASSTTGSSDDGFFSSTTALEVGECFDLSDFDEYDPPGECDVFEQDCAAGEKCTVADDDGDLAYDTTVCVTVDGEPAQVGDACTAELDTGADTCDTDAFCYFTFESAGADGVCVQFAQGSVDNPVCDDPSATATIVQDVVPLCLETCDPTGADCGIGHCMLAYFAFVCMDNYVANQGAGGEIACADASDCSDDHSCFEGTCRPHCDATEFGSCLCSPTCAPPPGLEAAGLCLP